MRPSPKYTAKLRKLLAQHFGAAGGEHFAGEGSEAEGIYPYVSFTLNLTS